MVVLAKNKNKIKRKRQSFSFTLTTISTKHIYFRWIFFLTKRFHIFKNERHGLKRNRQNHRFPYYVLFRSQTKVSKNEARALRC